MTSLITGGAGFIGSHLAEALLKKGHKVNVVDDLSTGRLENIQHLQDKPDFSFVEGDISDESLMESLIAEADELYHLAAVVGMKCIMEHPLRAFHISVDGTEIVLRLANREKKKVIFTSSSDAYGLWKSDASTKAGSEAFALAYWHDENLPVVITRIFDTCGPRQRFDEFEKQTGDHGMIVPRFVSAALLGKPLLVYGDGTQTRCFAYVGDVVKAIIGLMETEEAIGKIFNIGSTHEIQIKDLAKKVIELTFSSSEIKYVPSEEVYEEEKKEMKRSVPDISKINRLIGWQPEVGLDEMLQRVITYERARLDKKKDFLKQGRKSCQEEQFF
jgi:UDP-glucose 4-epimerase